MSSFMHLRQMNILFQKKKKRDLLTKDFRQGQEAYHE
jgi:hypothetical protein